MFIKSEVPEKPLALQDPERMELSRRLLQFHLADLSVKVISRGDTLICAR